jgi:MFS family permease
MLDVQALSGASFGLVACMPVVSELNRVFGSRICSFAGVSVLCGATTLLGTACPVWALTCTLVLWGVSSGLQDVSMNAQAVVLEQKLQQHIMSSFHAVFSTGGLFGAAIGGIIASRGWSVFPHLGLISGLTLLLSTGCAPLLLSANEERVSTVAEGDAQQSSTQSCTPKWIALMKDRSIICLAGIAFLSSIGEGSIGDWCAPPRTHISTYFIVRRSQERYLSPK